MRRTSEIPQKILQAARELFFVNGYANTQLRAIGSKAGTSESGILRHFESKKFLLRAVCDSCWAEVNAAIERALAIASERDSDPRNLLLEIMRTVLQFVETNKPMMTFLYTHFASAEVIGYMPNGNGSYAANLTTVGKEFQKYMVRIQNLCTAVRKKNPRFAGVGVTARSLQAFVQSGIYGIQASWYISEQGHMPEMYKIPIEEAVATLRCFLYQNATHY